MLFYLSRFNWNVYKLYAHIASLILEYYENVFISINQKKLYAYTFILKRLVQIEKVCAI